ncbi:uncharacterized protein LALA0_S03e00628g [Lachancea lanzarotensis]|uniref:LALA0S03e00628g1_1 n=1 Tax=Lachancea lanzarotensis TaxID=1245769 RepID=A0A0C7MUW5_9SACH|nr:uncharacterized protein LALA0_S03e00628g [Lachancea lanzarotensis]CEP61338.1 LALA0S03e00628g1_1 [Lachancea lanzarotensis]
MKDTQDTHEFLLQQDTEQTPRLPRDTFSSGFHHELTKRKRAYTVLAVMIGIMGMLIILAYDGNDEVFIVLLVLLLLLGVPVTLYMFVSSTLLSHNNKLLMLKLLVAEDPGLDSAKWDTVAAKSNWNFHNSDPSMTPYFFYDGDACLTYFRENMLQPYSRAQVAEGSNGTSLTTEGTEGTNGTPNRPHLVLPSIKDDPELGPWTKIAVERYLAHLEASIQELVNPQGTTTTTEN